MDAITMAVVAFQALILAAGLVALIYLVFRRLEIKKRESFEKRDN
ncbi:MAG: multisubunit Na+/H+ antiporter MnhB subunit [Bacteroidia bacterium]|jgi:multisubunit Na+/H+ antiporter MnhB subunit